jgi:hypothetical protein
MHEASQLDIIEAFADGEAVDPSALVNALSSPAGRAHLVDVIVLRELVSGGGQIHTRPAIAPAAPTRTLRLQRVAIAASLALVAALGGYTWGQRNGPSAHPPIGPSIAPAPSQVAAPAPTRTIKLEPGVDWTERVGGS